MHRLIRAYIPDYKSSGVKSIGDEIGGQNERLLFISPCSAQSHSIPLDCLLNGPNLIWLTEERWSSDPSWLGIYPKVVGKPENGDILRLFDIYRIDLFYLLLKELTSPLTRTWWKLGTWGIQIMQNYDVLHIKTWRRHSQNLIFLTFPVGFYFLNPNYFFQLE